eukprot:2867566-Rhodomonas_salina.1
MEYTGEVISRAEKDTRLRAIGPDGHSYFQEFYDYTPQSCIDSKFYGSPARFINHVCGEANIKFETWWSDGVPRCAM